MITMRRHRVRGVAPLFVALLLGGCSAEDEPAPGAAVDERLREHMDEEEHADEEGHTEEEGRVELGEAAFANAGIVVAEVTTREVAADASAGVVVPGQVEFDPARVTLVSPRTSGRIERLTVVEGDEVGAGQPLAHVLSPAFLTAQNDFLHAVRRAEMLAGTDEEPEARALAEAARRRLDLLGAGEGVVERLRAGEQPLDLIPITAPFAGSIVEAHALTGAAVEPGSPIFTLADLSVVNVVAEVPERSLSLLRLGRTTRIELAAYPDTAVRGTIERIREELDPATRTARAIIRVPNPRRLLRPGMFASVHLEGAGDGPRVARPVIPAEAVIEDGAERYVFVELAPRVFERRNVEVAPLGEGELLVRAGLAPGERVVVRGAFTLKSELGRDEFGGHQH